MRLDNTLQYDYKTTTKAYESMDNDNTTGNENNFMAFNNHKSASDEYINNNVNCAAINVITYENVFNAATTQICTETISGNIKSNDQTIFAQNICKKIQTSTNLQQPLNTCATLPTNEPLMILENSFFWQPVTSLVWNVLPNYIMFPQLQSNFPTNHKYEKNYYKSRKKTFKEKKRKNKKKLRNNLRSKNASDEMVNNAAELIESGHKKSVTKCQNKTEKTCENEVRMNYVVYERILNTEDKRKVSADHLKSKCVAGMKQFNGTNVFREETAGRKATSEYVNNTNKPPKMSISRNSDEETTEMISFEKSKFDARCNKVNEQLHNHNSGLNDCENEVTTTTPGWDGNKERGLLNGARDECYKKLNGRLRREELEKAEKTSCQASGKNIMKTKLTEEIFKKDSIEGKKGSNLKTSNNLLKLDKKTETIHFETRFKRLDGNKPRKGRSGLRCNVCMLELNGVLQAMEHCKGKNHRSKCARRNSTWKGGGMLIGKGCNKLEGLIERGFHL